MNMQVDRVLQQDRLQQGTARISQLFLPESVAIVGAPQKGGFATEILTNIKKWGLAREVVAANPRYTQIAGRAMLSELESHTSSRWPCHGRHSKQGHSRGP
ncbi:hypothetical protein [Bradyrhizobium sp. USDA 3315]